MSIEDIKKAVADKSLPMEVAEKYLKLYVADIEWQQHITRLWNNSLNKLKDIDHTKQHLKNAIACTTILPLVEKTPIPDPPQNLLFWCPGWHQFKEQDWFESLIEIMREDIIISENRNKIIKIGVIDPIDVSPVTRQAYNWLYDKVLATENIDSLNKKDLELKLANLVRAYGGSVICSMFMNYKLNVDKVLNWRSGYFFEKQIYKVYNIDQILKIKTTELNKTNQKYIKKIGANNG